MSFSVGVIDKLAALVTVAFGLVVALAWNFTIQEILKEIFGHRAAFQDWSIMRFL